MHHCERNAHQYLLDRNLTEDAIAAIGIRYLSREDAISLGFGMRAVSPQGVIAFPLNQERTVFIARNFYETSAAEQEHLDHINEYNSKQGRALVKRVPKYILPTGSASHGLLFDPYALIHPDADETVLFCTEDIIGAVKVAQRGIRVLSSAGVWLETRANYEDSQSDPDWQSQYHDRFPVFIADSDCLEKAGVAAAIVRTGFLVGCRVGCFPPGPKKEGSEDREKTGLDEWLDRNPNLGRLELECLVYANCKDPLQWTEEKLSGLFGILTQEYGHDSTSASKIFGECKKEVLNEILKHTSSDVLRAGTFFDTCKQSFKLTLEDLKKLERRAGGSGRDEDDPTPVDTLVEIVKKHCHLYRSADKQPFVDVVVDGVRHTYMVGTPDFRDWLTVAYIRQVGKPAKIDHIKEAIAATISLAKVDSIERSVYLRVANANGKHYIDIGNEQRQVIEIDADDWRVIDRSEPRFVRYPQTGALPMPVRGDGLKALSELRAFLLMDGQERDADWLLLLAFTLYSMGDRLSYVLLFLAATHGSGKSTLANILKRLIDPGRGVTALYTDEHKLAIAAMRRHLLCYDNVSHINPGVSDNLCRMATGFEFTTRTLFETMGETLVYAKRPQIITAIDEVVTRGDLADRLIAIELPPIPKDKRVADSELNQAIEEMLPSLLGALLTLLSMALNELPTVSREGALRMADFHLFGRAVARAIGKKEEDFDEAFSSNRENSRATVLEASPVTEALMRAFPEKDCKTFTGTATDLLIRLRAQMTDDPDILKGRTWPKNARALSSKLRQLKPDLEAKGFLLSLTRSGDANGTRTISIGRLATDV